MPEDDAPAPVTIDPKLASTVLESQISEAKSSVGVYDLPCGYIDEDGNLHREVKVREITGHEEDMLANPKLKGAKKINDLIASCVERVGTITDKGQLSKVVMDMTVGDRLFCIFAIRRVTVGDEYMFETACKSCQSRTKFTVDLADLEVKAMEDPYQREFTVTLPASQKVVVFRPMTGRGEEQLDRLNKKKTDSLSLSILMRVQTIDGKRPNMAVVKELGLGDRAYLRDRFEESEGGVDTEVELDCPECYSDFKEDLDVGQASFFFPSGSQES
jgi:hypothetical protein